jgi:hypothetical protein
MKVISCLVLFTMLVGFSMAAFSESTQRALESLKPKYQFIKAKVSITQTEEGNRLYSFDGTFWVKNEKGQNVRDEPGHCVLKVQQNFESTPEHTAVSEQCSWESEEAPGAFAPLNDEAQKALDSQKPKYQPVRVKASTQTDSDGNREYTFKGSFYVRDAHHKLIQDFPGTCLLVVVYREGSDPAYFRRSGRCSWQ